jgi:UDP-N-acetylmuramoylalanine--D-glutamate ligase
MESLIKKIKFISLTFTQIKKQITSLSQVKFRQEIIFENKKLLVVNDSSATSPDATIAALKRFKQRKNSNLLLITGGTDKNLEYDELAKKIKKDISPKNLVILNGSASKKLVKALNTIKYSNKYFVFESLDECFYYSLYQRKQKKRNIILFSPAATSFEKFKNEFDRAEQFNKLVKTIS